MKIEFFPRESEIEPRHWARHALGLAMILQPGSIEWGPKRSSMERVDYAAGDMVMCPHHQEKWVGLMNAPHLKLIISDEALMAASDQARSEVELRAYSRFTDSRLGGLVAAVHAEMDAGFPSGRLFLDSIEQAIALALVNGHAVRHHTVQIYKGGLASARLRRIKELVQAKIEEDLSLDEMAQSVSLSTAHFARMFRKSTGETPHQFVLRQKLERAKDMLRAPNARILDVAVACGFRTQQHFAQVFRNVCGTSPTGYRRDFLGWEVPGASETRFEDTQRL
jgi:AraC family transcriptional regulator